MPLPYRRSSGLYMGKIAYVVASYLARSGVRHLARGGQQRNGREANDRFFVIRLDVIRRVLAPQEGLARSGKRSQVHSGSL